MKSTQDIWFASFLHMEGYTVVNYDILKRGKGKYFFEITDERWKFLKLKFSASPVSQIKTSYSLLKDMLY